ncbi:restriction endonuclease subunit S [Flavobacterium soyangense]|uniref:Restriction endonuclease subunit S n=1 Tax=Flavobacterium soyangense TaxID=2023265 RepID=A0A930XUI4_9FLAO|nr:restriction endonuclease subunit S [Flavobacterium soyangense]MBF2707206.1 restriction endonuclease subunit S [Flavobacterium soyangense]
MNIPSLRFPEFKGEWENTKLGKVAKFSKGKGISKSEISEDGINECIRYGELYTRYGEVIEDVFSKTNFDINKSVVSEANDVIIPASGETQIDIATASCVMKSGVILGGDLNIIKTNKNGVFLSYYLNSKRKLDIANLAQGISVVHLYSSQLALLNLNFPTLPEQQKIATFLTTVDEKLQALKQKKSLLEQYKKGVMQKIFSQELRFAADNGNAFADWEEKKLGDVCKTTKSGGTPTSTKREYYNGDIPFLSISDMTSQGKYLNYTSNHISKLGLDNSASWVVPAHSIIYSMYASVGFVAINNIPLATSQAVLNLILKEGINTDYIYYTLVDFQKKIAQFVTTGTQGNLNAQSVKGFEIQIPCLEEQTKIASFLSTIDEKINHCKAQITNTEVWKRGLLQQLFV